MVVLRPLDKFLVALAVMWLRQFYDDIAKYANTAAGYHTYPHEDMYETALRAGRPLLSMIAGECQPVISWGNRRMLPHIMRQSTLDPYPGREFKTPNKAIQARCLEMETSGDALIASVFVGFPHAVCSNPLLRCRLAHNHLRHVLLSRADLASQWKLSLGRVLRGAAGY